MLSATIDWRDESVRCVGVFRSDDGAAMEVEYKIRLDDDVLDFLAKAFLKAGVPILRGSEEALPKVTLRGETLMEYTPARPPATKYNMDGSPKIDKRTRAYREAMKQPETSVLPTNGDGA
jgi:hypothetical protein